MSGANFSSPLRREDWVLCVRSCIVRVSDGLVWLISLVFHYWWEKRRCLYGFNARVLITADREIVPISSGASPYHQLGWAETYCKKAFVRFRLLMLWYSIPFSTKTTVSTAVSANPTKDFGKTPRSRRHEQSIPPIMKNERPNAQQNLLKRERSRPEHKQLYQIPNWGRAIRTGIQLPKWATSPRQPNQPAAAIPRGEELESRG